MLLRGEFRPGGVEREWCDPEVLRLVRRRSLARLRREIEPVEPTALARFLPAGFYYKMFMHPRSFWKHVYEPFIRQAAGLGQAPSARDEARGLLEELQADVDAYWAAVD